MRILLSNDDGICAPGLLALKQALEPLGTVFVAAPDKPRSATGHAVTLHKPLRLVQQSLADGSSAWASNGMPTDCVTLCLDVLMEGRADVAFIGINDGANLGWDITYSGTVMAAMEAAILGVPAVAISVVSANGPASNYGPAAAFARELAEKLMSSNLDRYTLLNVNVPDTEAMPREVAVTHQGRREYTDRIVTRLDPRGRPYHWLTGAVRDDETENGSDLGALRRGAISVTPIQIDQTARAMLGRLQNWWPRRDDDRAAPRGTEQP